MTTTVTVKTHDWPVRIDFIDKDSNGKWSDIDKRKFSTLNVNYVEQLPYTEANYYPHDSRRIFITELPIPYQKRNNV